MRISVIVPTCRVGGLDVLLDGLARQTFPDFELVLADSARRDVRTRNYGVRANGGNGPFPLVHVHVPPDGFRENRYCRHVNDAVERATGDVLLFLTDYSWIPMGYLQAHADFHASHGLLDCLSTPHRYARRPALSPEFPGYDARDSARYLSDLESGALRPCYWSTFAAAFDPELLEDDDAYVTDVDRDGAPVISGGRDPKFGAAPGPMSPGLVHLKGESLRRGLLEGISAAPGRLLPEALDGGHGFQDTWLGLRAARAGASWHLDPSQVVRIPQVRDVFPRMPRTRSFADQESLMHSLLRSE